VWWTSSKQHAVCFQKAKAACLSKFAIVKTIKLCAKKGDDLALLTDQLL
jgi:hypothetical protein